jgi:peptide chain release factor subunit 1
LIEETLARLLQFRSADAPVLSVYVANPLDPADPPDPGEARGTRSGIHSMLKPLRELIESHELAHSQRESLRADVARVADLATRASEFEGRAVAAFACSHDGFYEEVVVPRRMRGRAVVDATPYLRPLLAVLDEYHHYCVVVIERARAWWYESFADDFRESAVDDERVLLSKRTGDEWHAHNRAETLTRRHYRHTAETLQKVMQETQAEFVIVGGHRETVAEFLPFLHGHESMIAGTFVIDTHTLSTPRVREQALPVVEAFEREEEARLVQQVLERVAEGGFAARGLDWCLLATNEKAVELLLVHGDARVPGRICDQCGWLGLGGEECPVDGRPTRATTDVIDDMAEAVVVAGGRVEHVYADTELAAYGVGALLRFPVLEP